MGKPRLLVFASGSKTGGGSGFEKLVLATQEGVLEADIIAVVTNHSNGGVVERAKRLGVQYVYFSTPWEREGYERIVKGLKPDFIALSGWLKFVYGLDPRITFNIHPGPLPKFGGPGMHGHHVHEAVHAAFHAGRITQSEVSMHFIVDSTDKKDYDKGPLFFRKAVSISADDTPDDIGASVNAYEHLYQPAITNLVVTGQISWDGKDPSSLRVPDGYQFLTV